VNVRNPTTTLRHQARRFRKLLTAAAVMLAGRALLGPWPIAVLLAAAGLWWGLALWARIERRRPAVRPNRAWLPPDGHVVFARALAAVAVEYLAECEREVDQP
jgi:hypothetical protein